MSTGAGFERGEVRVGRARGRYFRENFAQGGIDLVQVIPELVTNSDAAITASGRERVGSSWSSERRIPRSWSAGARGCGRCARRRC